MLIPNLYTVSQIRDVEQLAIQKEVSASELMLRAGNSVFKLLTESFPKIQKLIVVCGKGNNGGDGFIVARLAYFAAIGVTVYTLCDISECSASAREAALACQEAGVTIKPYIAGMDFEADVIIDAILGIGLNNEVQGLALAAINSINQSSATIISLDVPSGVQADTGAVLGAAVNAHYTQTFIGMKRGLFTGEAVDHCGKISCADLDLGKYIAMVSASAVCINTEDLVLKTRRRSAHKGNFGHVLIVGGDYGMAGAVTLAATAAYRSGAGLVTVATRPEHVAAIVAHQPEIMCYGINHAEELTPLLNRATVCVLGPGLGSSPWSSQLFNLVQDTQLPKVIDASGLNLLAAQPAHQDLWVLTPHPGEAARLLECDINKIQQNRFESIQLLQQKYGGIIVLKGAGTLIHATNSPTILCDQGNPGMASGGMGDVLSGIIAALIAQHYSLLQAAAYGVVLHANAADLASEELGQMSLLASDVINFLPDLLNASPHEK